MPRVPASSSFRTLASHFETPSSSNPFAFIHFRTFCQIPEIRMPSSLFFIFRCLAPSRSEECAQTPLSVTLAHFRGRVSTSIQESRTKMKLESLSPARLVASDGKVVEEGFANANGQRNDISGDGR